MVNKKSLLHRKKKGSKSKIHNPGRSILAVLGMAGLITGCNSVAAQIGKTNPQQTVPPVTASPTNTTSPTLTATPIPPTFTPTATSSPSPTITPSPAPWPTPTPISTSTPWTIPAAWSPAPYVPPTLVAVPVVPTMPRILAGVIPVSYSPPDGVDVFGNTILRWTYYGELAPDEWFDIKIKPLGSDDSAFVDWSKSTEYTLRPWSGWTPGLYTWQIGIVKGYKEGETKHFIADAGRDSEKFIIKWQGGGSDSGGGNNNGGGSSSSDGGNSSGGS